MRSSCSEARYAANAALACREELLLLVLAPVIDQRRVVLDDGPLAHHLRELGEVVLDDGASASLGQALLKALAGLLVSEFLHQYLDVEVRVPHVEHPHLAELPHALPVGAHAGEHRVPRVVLAEAVAAAGQHEAGGQPLDVPLPGRRQGLVEIVDVEDHPPLRRGEDTEVGQVTVATGLHAKPRGRRAGEVGSHVQRRTPVERERRFQHAPVANGHQLRNAAPVGLLYERDGIGAPVRRLPHTMRLARALLPQALALRVQLVERRTGHDGERRRRLERSNCGPARCRGLGHPVPPLGLPDHTIPRAPRCRTAGSSGLDPRAPAR